MKIKIYIMILFIIFLTSLTSVGLLLLYMDIESNFKVAIISMAIASFLTLTSIFTLIIYFFKKIYYRGEIYLSNLNSSLRQGILITIFILGLIVFNYFGVYTNTTMALFFLIILFLELILQSISD